MPGDHFAGKALQLYGIAPLHRKVCCRMPGEVVQFLRKNVWFNDKKTGLEEDLRCQARCNRGMGTANF